MKVYIAGKIREGSERDSLEKIDSLCSELGFDTFLPHRDVGMAKGVGDVERVFKGDIVEGFRNVDGVVALLDGLHVGAGTAWEIGYAYAKGIPIIGLKTDESVEEAFEYLSAIILYSVKIVDSYEKLRVELEKLKKLKY